MTGWTGSTTKMHIVFVCKGAAPSCLVLECYFAGVMGVQHSAENHHVYGASNRGVRREMNLRGYRHNDRSYELVQAPSTGGRYQSFALTSKMLDARASTEQANSFDGASVGARSTASGASTGGRPPPPRRCLDRASSAFKHGLSPYSYHDEIHGVVIKACSTAVVKSATFCSEKTC